MDGDPIEEFSKWKSICDTFYMEQDSVESAEFERCKEIITLFERNCPQSTSNNRSQGFDPPQHEHLAATGLLTLICDEHIWYRFESIKKSSRKSAHDIKSIERQKAIIESIQALAVPSKTFDYSLICTSFKSIQSISDQSQFYSFYFFPTLIIRLLYCA